MPNLTSAQVAKLTGKSVRTIHRMVGSHRLRYAQKFPGGTGGYLFRPSDVRKAFPGVVIDEQPPADTERVSA